MIPYTLCLAMLASGLVGLLSGGLGCFAVLRRHSLLGDAIAHAALPGIGLAYWITHSKTSGVLLVGAIVAGWTGTLLVGAISRRSIIKEDAALGIILSVFFGIGLVILTALQRHDGMGQAGLSSWLFGSIAGVSIGDVWVLGCLTAAGLCVLWALWHPLVVLAFDPHYANTIGFQPRILEWILTLLLVLAIAVGLQVVGVVLMSSLVIAHAVAARQWVNRMGSMVLVAMGIGACSTMGGVWVSTQWQWPTGPTIVVGVSLCVLISILLAPHRGLWWRYRAR
ncbi:metal ABC transporter permease [bacterium]|nr:metal ABC transporter permease [bacterium]